MWPSQRAGGWAASAAACVALVVALVVALTACSSHPVGPARTDGSYESKARTTAESALSAVETVRLAARAGADGNAFGPYLGVLVSDQEEALATVQGTFGSIQPPSTRSDGVRTALDEVLSVALDHVADVRVAIRRGRLADLADVAGPLRDDAAALRAFLEAHR